MKLRTFQQFTGIIGGIAALSLVATTLQAAVIFSDGFESPTPGDPVSGQGGWQGTGGNAEEWTVTAGGVSNTDITGGSLHAQLDGQITAETPVWHAYTPQTSTVYARINFHNPSPSGSSQFFWFGLSDDGDDDNSLGLVYRSSGFRARIRDNSGMNSSDVSFPTGSGLDTLYTFVIKAEKDGSANFNRISIFVNPDLAGSSLEPATPLATFSRDSQIDTLSSIFFRAGSNSPNNNESFLVDEVLVGSQWNDLIIPEPTSAALLGLAGLALLARRRQKA